MYLPNWANALANTNRRRLEGKRECIVTDGMGKHCKRTHWETFYHENRELKKLVSLQYAN